MSKEEKEYWESLIKALRDIRNDLKELNDKKERNDK